jgi:hypothetical protein
MYLGVTISGQAFGSVPTVVFERTADLDGTPVIGPAESVEVQSDGTRISGQLRFDESAPLGVYRVRVRGGGGRDGVLADALLLLPSLVVDALDAPALCVTGEGATLGLRGSALPVVDGAGPSMTLRSAGSLQNVLTLMPVLDGCRTIPFSRAAVQLCTRAAALLDRRAPIGAFDVVVAPPPALPTFTLPALPVLLTVPLPSGRGLPRPATDGPLDFVLCDGPMLIGPPGQTLSVVHKVGSSLPATIDGVAASTSLDGCVASHVPGYELCATLRLRIPQATAGLHTMTVAPLPGCESVRSATFIDRPVIASVSPGFACTGANNGGITIQGSRFFDPHVYLDTIELFVGQTCPSMVDGMPAPCERLVAFAAGVPPGTYTLRVENGSTPRVASAELPFVVSAGPPFVGDPRPGVFYAGMDQRVSVSVSGATGRITGTSLVPGDGAAQGIQVPFALFAGGVQLTVPAGTPEGWYQVQIQDESLCPGMSGYHTLVKPRASYIVFEDSFEADRGHFLIDCDAPFFSLSYDMPRVEGPGTQGNALVYGTDGVATSMCKPPWWFSAMNTWRSCYDLGLVRFDLRRSATGDAFDAPDVRFHTGAFDLEYVLSPPPTDQWTHYVVRLDDPTGWIFHGADGAREATAEDLRTAFDADGDLQIRGQHGSGVNEAMLDNVALELRR